tara:strand:- start:211 stop:630 length:420 start_codon:yes stop_codon:yes gene_type:complete
MTKSINPPKTTMELQNEIIKLKIEVEKYEKTKQSKRLRQKRYYDNKFKISQNLSDEEKEQIKKNKQRINKLAKNRYKENPEKSKTRCRDNYFKKLSPAKQKIYLERKKRREERKALEERKTIFINKSLPKKIIIQRSNL